MKKRQIGMFVGVGLFGAAGAWGHENNGQPEQPEQPEAESAKLSAEDLSLLGGNADKAEGVPAATVKTQPREGDPGVIKSFFDGDTLIDLSQGRLIINDQGSEETTVITTGSTMKASQWRARMFKPSARIYFDIGDDDPGNEADIFVNGSITASIDVIEVGYWWDMGVATGGDLEGWGLGIVGSAGIGTPAITVMDDGSESSTSTAPVAIFNVGLSFEKVVGDPTKIKENGYLGLEVGYAQGFSTDENFGDNSDGAVYVGVNVDF